MPPSSSNISRLVFIACSGLLVELLGGCIGNQQPFPLPTRNPNPTPTVSPNGSPAPDSSPTQPNPFVAEIAEVLKPPVFVRVVNASQEAPGKPGMGLNIGDTIRTQGQALAQVNLNNGLGFRLGGNAALTLRPDNRLNLTSGDMITWVNPGQKVPAEIVTPTAVAGIRGTTVYVKIPSKPQEGTLFFAWEGAVSVRLPGQKEEILLRTAEEVRIKRGERDLRAIRRRIRRLPSREWRQRRQTDRLLRSFTTPLPTLPIIERIRPGQVNLTSP